MKAFKYLLLVLGLIILSGCAKEDPLAYISGATNEIEVIDEKNGQKVKLIRGTEVYVDEKIERDHTYRIYQSEDEKHFYIASEENITEDYQQVVTNPTVTSNMIVNLREDRSKPITDVIVKKGEEIKVHAVNMERDFNKEDGSVDGYMIEKDGKPYYLNALFTQSEMANKDGIYYSTFFDDWYGKGYSKKTYIDDLTYLNVDRSEFEGKPFKKDARAVHVGMSLVYDQQDYLIDLCNTTGIDTLVLEIKADDGRLIFQSDTAKQFLKDQSVAERTSVSKEEFAKIVEKYHENGIYLIGRMVTFKDPVFVEEYPEEAITYKNGDPFIHDGLAWPSPYSRKAWTYLLSYAKEAASLGIDEIQFDYVRFPDGMSDVEERLNLRNQYDESKPQAILHFLHYAREELREVKTYISADVFGWVMICGDDQEIGQFIPAVASVVDAISPMPYPDHFGAYSLGIAQPWQEPGALLEAFTAKSMEIINTIESPAVYRTWIQGYACLEWVCQGTSDNPSRGYGPDELIAQIQGIRNAGETGYIVWSGDGGEDMFEWRKGGFIE